jgi:cytochrome d ubiquinol oxidase subunit II
MAALWYAIVTAMLAAWAVLDGLDFGAGLAHFFVARTESERGVVLGAIGPIWDGNEVWLIASGGVLVFAFPRAYAAAFSGLYLPLMMVLWLLALRGIAIEFRGQVNDPLWRQAWDFVFASASALIAFVSGVALGNVLRGVPLDSTRRFHLDLFSTSGDRVAAIDGFTTLLGLTVTAVLWAHGAAYLAWKTGGRVHQRSLAAARRAWPVAYAMVLAATVATALERPAMVSSLARRPWAWPLLAGIVVAALFNARSLSPSRNNERAAFVASSAFIAALLLATGAALYPVLLPSTVDVRFDIDADAAASGETSLRLGLVWWVPAMALAVAYFVNLFRSMRGKAGVDYGH